VAEGSRRRWALAFAVALLGCDESNEGANGSPCLKNKDCASNRCVATTCQPQPVFGGQAAAGEAGAGGEAGAAGEAGAGGE
jgi:hypothetical protein